MVAVTENDVWGVAPENHVPASGERLRVLVVDDHPAVRRGLFELLSDQPDFQVIDVASSAEEAMSVAEREAIDVAVVDYQLDGRDGLWLSRKLGRLPRPPRVIIYSAYSDGWLAAAAAVAGADGLVNKGGLGSELCDAVRSVAAGRLLLPPIPFPLAELMRQRLDNEEQAIFGMSLAGIPPVDIAKTLGISRSGIESRLSQLLHKLRTMDGDVAATGRERRRAPARVRRTLADLPAR
jgi:two-component system, NarL family, response regulator DevR